LGFVVFAGKLDFGQLLEWLVGWVMHYDDEAALLLILLLANRAFHDGLIIGFASI
jgi:hypothetical protein